MNIRNFIQQYISLDSIPKISIVDIVEIVILSFLIYQVIIWIKKTRTWILLKGFAVMGAFVFVAWIFEMNTILWVFKNVFSIGITVLVIVFQPELRRALEMLGQQNILSSMFGFDNSKDVEIGFSDRTINEIVKASFEMGKAKTGALMVIERNMPLGDYERTGIALDSVLSSQLLINIFEHNTPLHDGAVLIRKNRIVSATCYLPLSDNLYLNKELGTRHRAAVGISEVSDSLTIVVSEETGYVSVAFEGQLFRNINEQQLREHLQILQDKTQDTKKFRLWKGRGKNERKADE
ncbi:MAG: diadenylate cyclase CdaA [Lachnospiraceae bacterium]|nr:diadenylate cyclase CdaA [Lachnospiraceae bacterium]